ncbi:MAG: molybdenum cofactor biosynthesis protein MoaE [Candidatus Thiodiazotropha sp. (ex Monitilora ramsayi)]|nr:molybdenum cofactor biosynthesis protein MoaE [Candidatus Thiodiazotropha sp. (ex Monitilora ramsayi)]
MRLHSFLPSPAVDAVKYIHIQSEPLDPHYEVDQLRADNPTIGGIVSFIGLMRDINEGDKVSRLFLEHYPGMTEKALEKIVDEAMRRWDLAGCRVVHRVGEMSPTDPIVVVVVASRHRKEAFLGCEFVIDYLKTQAPFWKKELTEGGERWVDARVSDTEAEEKWRTDELSDN